MQNNKLEKPEFVKNRFLPDSSCILSGQFVEFLESGQIYNYNNLKSGDKIEIILSRMVLAEIENQANQDKTSGIIGIEMLKLLTDKVEIELNAQGKDIEIIPYGERPSLEQVKLSSGGELDAAIRQHAYETKATLVTSDNVQADLGEIEKIPVIFIEIDEKKQIKGRKIQDFFDKQSMSVHLKNGCAPQAKKGSPGKWDLVDIEDNILSAGEIKEIESNIITEAKNDSNSFIEKDMQGVTVVQLRNYRIVICRPPFSDSHEITAVRPLVRLSLEDYNLEPFILKRLSKAEGVLIAGSPGAGKSTFISALTELYLKDKKLVKTLESVRDLQVPPEVSQYSDLEDDFEKTADILLLVRPDYTIFDEIRTSSDFKIFADMRLAGVGMVGVIHASSALDAIQRFIRRIELGVIPAVLDTVVFIKNGAVDEILKLEITVKTPSGFKDQSLARPVIEVSDFTRKKLLYEIYEFGSNVVVTPVKRGSGGGGRRSDDYYNKNRYQGSKGANTRNKKRKKDNTPPRERGYGEISTDIDDYLNSFENGNFPEQEFFEHNKEDGIINFKTIYGKKSIIFRTIIENKGKYIDLYADNSFIASLTINNKGEIRIDKKTHLFNKLDSCLQEGKNIYGKISD
ncbi:MAG: Flp pilus assembly complex ATPase component [archaeon]|nr:Flp pilus assembly complex ATPase component [archaeon]